MHYICVIECRVQDELMVHPAAHCDNGSYLPIPIPVYTHHHFLLTRFFPILLTKSAQNLSDSFGKSTFIGFLIILFIIPALILVAITIIGLPLAGMLFLFFLINFYIAKFAVGLYAGQLLVKRFNWKNFSMFKTLAVGLIAIYILKLFPVIGFLTSLVVLWAGLGSLFLFYRDLLLTPKAKR